MSTLTGQSPLQPLQERHRSSASRTYSSRQPPLNGPPRSISNSMRARPRVECSSSRVTMKLGHIVPASSLRHSPTPTQRSVAREKLFWSAANAKCVFNVGGSKSVPRRRLESSGYASTTLPGFILPPGPQMVLNPQKPCPSSGPYFFPTSPPRPSPPPSPPENAPPYFITRS